MKALVLAISALALSGCAEARDDGVPVDLAGDWTGYAITGDGTRLELKMTLDREESGYSGMLRDTEEAIPDMALRDIVFRDGTLTFELDYPADQGSELIKVTLAYRNDTLSGSYVDPAGDSDTVFFRRGSGE